MDKEIDWTENERRVRVTLLFCTCKECFSFNKIKTQDPLFGEPMIEYFCSRHSKAVTPDQEPCADFR